MVTLHTEILNTDTDLLSTERALSFVTSPQFGAETLFVGRVRDHNQGKKVLGITYDAFEPLALNTFDQLSQEAQSKWGPDLSIYIAHAKGKLPVGGISILIAVGSPHRDEAYQANRFLIEEIKHKAPIWKLEHYEEGDSQWTQGCELCHAHEPA